MEVQEGQEPQLAAPPLKRCARCAESKLLAEFFNASRRPDGKDYYCKPCRIVANKANPKRLEYQRKAGATWQAQHAQDRYRKENPRKYLFARARLRAQKFGREFSITLDDVVIPEVCPLLGVPISSYAEHSDFSPSLDRIDSTKGYVKGNVQVISHKANRLKNNACGEELLTLAINVLIAEGKLPKEEV